jgi:NAD(P)-dependent dehydrogenase (short-subunit alcohol dehydrogenase family)
LKDRVAIITGGSSGIGEAIAERFASLGAKVAVVARDLAKCEVVAKRLRDAGGTAIAVSCDVRDEAQVVACFNQVRDELGEVGVVVASAGISGGSTRVADYDLEDWNRVVETNITGVFLTVREAFRHMEAGAGGHIVVISSQAGVEGYAGKGVYCTSKFGVRGLAQALGQEGRRHNINVSSLCPGTAQTPILAATNTSVKHPLELEALADAAVYLATLRGNGLVRDIVLERMDQR